MEEGLKKRLVGAAVLASLAVIFVPMLIDEPVVSHPELREIPPPPERQDFASEMLREPVIRPEPVRVDLTSAQPQAATEPGPPSKPQPKPTPASKTERPAALTAWVIQVGSFSSRENAEKLVAKLRKAGFQTPDAERVELQGNTRYRVRVGPMVQKDKARRLLPKVDKVSGTQGRILRFK